MSHGAEYRVRAGNLRHPLRIQTKTEAQDGTGFPTRTWEDVPGIRWGEVRDLRSGETIQGEKVSSLATHRIQIRAISGLKPSQRIRWGTRFFNIDSLRDIDLVGKTQVLTAIEVVE